MLLIMKDLIHTYIDLKIKCKRNVTTLQKTSNAVDVSNKGTVHPSIMRKTQTILSTLKFPT